MKIGAISASPIGVVSGPGTSGCTGGGGSVAGGPVVGVVVGAELVVVPRRTVVAVRRVVGVDVAGAAVVVGRGAVVAVVVGGGSGSVVGTVTCAATDGASTRPRTAAASNSVRRSGQASPKAASRPLTLSTRPAMRDGDRSSTAPSTSL